MCLVKVISGGQNGVDQAAIRAAKICGLSTGGWIPKGFLTLDGPRPDLIAEYNLTEHRSSSYNVRTEQNVIDSDGTIRFATDFNSRGEKCTLRHIKNHQKPYFDINSLKPLLPELLADWIVANKIRILNVAGNAENTSPGIGRLAEEYFVKVFNCFKQTFILEEPVLKQGQQNEPANH